MSVTWKSVGENLVRHSGGTIYLRGRVGGKPIRVSLETEDLRLAKIARDAKLEQLREGAKVKDVGGKKLKHFLATLSERMLSPHLKASTVRYYEQMITILTETLDTEMPAKSWNQPSKWWRSIAERYSPQRANNVLSMARRLGDLIVESGQASTNPTKSLKRMPIGQKKLEMPSRETLLQVIESIRTQGKRASIESANYVSFLAYTGCRHGEAKGVEWKHVGDDWIQVKTAKSRGTTDEYRSVPINDSLRALLASMRTPDSAGPVFHISSPRIALDNACKRLKVPHLRLHDLRHYFITWAVECGVDAPTIARWVGHKDGGVLIMKVYCHTRDDHSLAQAKKLQ